MKKLAQEDAENRLKELGINFEPFVYEGVYTKISHYCKNCGGLKKLTFHCIVTKRNDKCKKCYTDTKNRIIELLDKYNSKYINHFLNKFYQIMVVYTCPICGKIIVKRLSSLRDREEFRCNDCRYNEVNKWQRNKQEDVEKELRGLGFELGEFVYQNHYTKIPHKCPQCGKWKHSTLHSMRHRKCLCPTCARNEKFTQDTIEERLKSLGIIFHQFHFNSINDIIEIECPKCGNPHKKSIRNLIYERHYFCDECKMSALERTVYQYLKNMSIKFEYNYRKIKWLRHKNNLELDFYLPDYNIAIECQGRQHFESNNIFDINSNEFDARIERDEIKKKLCEEHNLQLFHINYDENIEEKLNGIIKMMPPIDF
jgi:DNA-directed RNA polymerase subunit RPC12/RpoP